MPQRYYFSGAEPVNLNEISAAMTNSTVRFVFDTQVEVTPNEMLELDNGQWFLTKRINGKRVCRRLHGKWDR